MKYRIFRRSIPRKKRLIKAYYYWYRDALGKRVVRSCGKNHTPCTTRAVAEEFVRQLEEKEREKTKERKGDTATVAEVAGPMFVPGLPHMKRREQLGKRLSEKTCSLRRAHIENYIIPIFGEIKCCDIFAPKIVDWLSLQNKSSSWKNQLIGAFSEILSEAQRSGVIENIPVFERFADDSIPQAILSTEELELLFGEPTKAIIWREDPLTFYTFFLLAVSAGLRLGEAQAFRSKQFFSDKQALVIDRFLRGNGTAAPHLKKGSHDDPRARVVLIPERTCLALQRYIEERACSPEALLFQYKNRSIRKEFAGHVFARALARANISTEGRKITPHALRYTYVTRTRRLTDTETVMKMAGHSSIGMTDHYTRIEATEVAKELQGKLGAVNRFFS